MFKKFEDDEDTGNHDYGDWDYKMSGLKFDSWKGMWQDTVLKTFSMKNNILAHATKAFDLIHLDLVIKQRIVR
jgi:hypothetical protein